MSVICRREADQSGSGTSRSGTSRLRRTTAMAVLLTSVTLLAGACGSDEGKKSEVASVPSAGQSSESTADQSSKADPVEYAKCMRQNGVADFPDPRSGGGITLPKGVDPQSDAFKKSEEACKEYRPNRGSVDVPGGNEWSSDDQVKFAQCMRKNGLSDFPDPDAEGGVILGQGTGVDPKSEQFKKADAACKQYKPQGAPGVEGGN
ncbi:hypothetical protein GCM10010232_70670 [Streptomyces amakusaensis]|uniref:Lipoprotein n=1 Tax=Streptomyces amakusaensis TaxID=67271 RepID=A0ABW0AW26_9ACTN